MTMVSGVSTNAISKNIGLPIPVFTKRRHRQRRQTNYPEYPQLMRSNQLASDLERSKYARDKPQLLKASTFKNKMESHPAPDRHGEGRGLS